MKRSEILEEIVEHFIAYSYLTTPPKESANFLLTKLEKMGMLPPDTKKGFWVSVNYGTQYANYEERKPDHRWEPEDET